MDTTSAALLYTSNLQLKHKDEKIALTTASKIPNAPKYN